MSRGTILVVEPDYGIRERLDSHFTNLGYDVYSLENSLWLLAFSKAKPDVFIIDSAIAHDLRVGELLARGSDRDNIISPIYLIKSVIHRPNLDNPIRIDVGRIKPFSMKLLTTLVFVRKNNRYI